MIFYKFPRGPLRTNALLVGCSQERRVMAIDPSQSSCTDIVQTCAKLGLSLERIVLTHSHWDHIADVDVLHRTTNAPVYVHALDAANLQEPGSDHLPFPIIIPGVCPDGFVSDGEEIALGTICFVVIHTPGHSPGSVCYYAQKQKLLITGDTLFKGAMGNIRLPTSNPEQMTHSLRKLAQLPLDTRIVPGHGSETTLVEEGWILTV